MTRILNQLDHIPRPASLLEATLEQQLIASGVIYPNIFTFSQWSRNPVDFPRALVREFVFTSKGRWRFDFAFPALKLAVECEGAQWGVGRRCYACGQRQNGGHTSGAGYEKDCRKYSLAAIEGWCVIRATSSMINSLECLELVESAFQARLLKLEHE